MLVGESKTKIMKDKNTLVFIKQRDSTNSDIKRTLK